MCPYYLSIGMTYEQYWDSSPFLVIAYRKADKFKRERINEQLWLQGAYIYEAFSVVLSNAFSKRGGTKHKYPNKPYEIFEKDDRQLEIEAEEERNKAINSLDALKLSMDFKFKEIKDVGNS